MQIDILDEPDDQITCSSSVKITGLSCLRHVGGDNQEPECCKFLQKQQKTSQKARSVRLVSVRFGSVKRIWPIRHCEQRAFLSSFLRGRRLCEQRSYLCSWRSIGLWVSNGQDYTLSWFYAWNLVKILLVTTQFWSSDESCQGILIPGSCHYHREKPAQKSLAYIFVRLILGALPSKNAIFLFPDLTNVGWKCQFHAVPNNNRGRFGRRPINSLRTP